MTMNPSTGLQTDPAKFANADQRQVMIDKAMKMDKALAQEIDTLRENGRGTAAMHLDDFLHSSNDASKARLYDIIMKA